MGIVADGFHERSVESRNVAHSRPGARADIFDEGFSPKAPSTMRLSLTLGGESALRVRVTSDDGTQEHFARLNRGRAFESGTAFSILGPDMVPGFTYNVQLETDIRICQMVMSEILGGTTGGYGPAQGQPLPDTQQQELSTRILDALDTLNEKLTELQAIGLEIISTPSGRL